MKNKPYTNKTVKPSSRYVTVPKKNEVKKDYCNIFAIFTIILSGILIYSNSFFCSFHFDDLYNIVNNPHIRDLSNLEYLWSFSHTRFVAYYSFALNYHFNQLDVWGYHLVNLCIHIINSCLVWWLTLLIFSSPAVKDHSIAKNKKLLAFLTALLFVSHPLATQSVTYIVQRLASLVTLFYLLSIVLYLKARISEMSQVGKILLFSGSFLSVVLAMFTKENSFTLPFAILLAEFFFIQNKKNTINLKDYRVILFLVLILGIILIIPASQSLSIFSPIPPSMGHTNTITPYNYLLTQFSVIVKYIQLLFIPANLRLDYDYPISNTFFELRTVLGLLVILTLIALGVFLFKRNRVISFGIFWFFLTLSIESSFIPIADVIYEHRTYLPSFGFFLCLTSSAFSLISGKYKTLTISAFLLVVAINSYLTYQRNKTWRDEITLWTDHIEKSPKYARYYSSRGYIYLQLQQYEKCIEDCSTAIMIDSNFADPYNHLGLSYIFLKKYDYALYNFSKAISITPDFAIAYCNRGNTYKELGRWEDALEDYNKAIDLLPKFIDAYFNRAIVYTNIDNYGKAIDDYSKVILLQPDYADAYVNRGNLHEQLQQRNNAIHDYLKAVEINPNFAEAYFNLGITYGNQNEWSRSIDCYTKAIQIIPNHITAFYNRGVAFSNLKDWDRAISDFNMVLYFDSRFKQAYVNRGIAYANRNEWDKAIDDYTSALLIDPNYISAYNNREAAIQNQKNDVK